MAFFTMAHHLGAPVVIAMAFFGSIIIIPFIAAVRNASRPNLKRNGLYNLDLESAQGELHALPDLDSLSHLESVQSEQQALPELDSPSQLRQRSNPPISSKPPIQGLIPIPSKPLTSSLSSTGPSDPLTPSLISIGPSHFSMGVGEKLPMEHLKLDYLQHCLGRLPQLQKQSDFEARKKCIKKFILEKKESICQCYEGYVSKCKDGYDKSFADNVMNDSFFVFELFFRALNPSEHRNDELLSCKKNRNGVREDLVLMTNQLPYFFLRDLYGSVFDSSSGYPSFDSLTQNYIGKLPLITGYQEGLVDSCCSGFSHWVEDCFRYLFYCFWTRHLTTCCNSGDSDDNHVAISITDQPVFQLTNLLRDRVIKGNTRHQGSTGNRPHREESSSHTSAGMIGVNSSPKPSSSALRGEGPIHEGLPPSSSTGNRPLREAASSSSSAGMTGVKSSPGPSSSASSKGEGPIHKGSTPFSSKRNRPLHVGSSSSMTDADSDLGGDSFSSSREKRPLYEGLSSSSMTGNRTTREIEFVEFPPNGGSSSSQSRGNRKIHKVSPFSSPRGHRFIAVDSATKLQQVGVKLKASDDGCLINIKFGNGILRIPPLELYDYTERTLQNLIAYEQRAFPEQAYIFSYIKFMESLVKTKDDVDLLIDKGIIVNLMAGGHKEVKELLQRLCKDIVLPSVFYPKICQQLKKHRGNCWYRILAEFVDKPFGKPLSRFTTTMGTLMFFLLIIRFILPYIRAAPWIHSG